MWMCLLRMETPPLRVGTCPFRMEMLSLQVGTCPLCMETPLRGRSGGHTGAAPTISRMAHVIKLPENSSPMHKIKEDCVVEGFDGGW